MRLFDVFALDIIRVIPTEPTKASGVDLRNRKKRFRRYVCTDFFERKVTFAQEGFGAYTPRKRLDCRLRDTLDGALLRRSV